VVLKSWWRLNYIECGIGLHCFHVLGLLSIQHSSLESKLVVDMPLTTLLKVRSRVPCSRLAVIKPGLRIKKHKHTFVYNSIVLASIHLFLILNESSFKELSNGMLFI
jgi:hypothetical protein